MVCSWLKNLKSPITHCVLQYQVCNEFDKAKSFSRMLFTLIYIVTRSILNLSTPPIIHSQQVKHYEFCPLLNIPFTFSKPLSDKTALSFPFDFILT